MTYLGHYQNGVIVLDNGATIPEGARVRVELVDRPSALARQPVKETPGGGRTTIASRLARVLGKGHGLPPDLAENHDHYIHGAPKK
jgi:hypothetical protein